jgi:hypothetical protein
MMINISLLLFVLVVFFVIERSQAAVLEEGGCKKYAGECVDDKCEGLADLRLKYDDCSNLRGKFYVFNCDLHDSSSHPPA